MPDQNVVEIVLRSIDEFSADLKTIEGRLSGLEKGSEKAQAGMEDLTKSSKDSSKAIEVLNTAMTSLGAIAGPLNTNLRFLSATMGLLARSLPVAAVGAAAVGFIELAKSIANSGAEIARLKDLTQLSAETLSGIRIAAEQNDSSLAQFSQSLSFLQRNLSNAARGVPEATSLFRNMGFTIDEIKDGLTDFDSFIVKFAQRLFEFPKASDRMQLALQATGRGGRDTLNTFKALSEQGISPFIEQAKKLGVFISDDFAKKSREFNDNLNLTTLLFKGFAAIIAGPVISALRDLLDWYFKLARIKIEPPDFKKLLADAQAAIGRLQPLLASRLKAQGIDVTELFERGDFAETSQAFAQLKRDLKFDGKTLLDMQLYLDLLGDQNDAVAGLTKNTEELKGAQRDMPDPTQIKFQNDLARVYLATASAREQLRFELEKQLATTQLEPPSIPFLISQSDLVAAARLKELMADINAAFETEKIQLGDERAAQLQSARQAAAQLEIEKLRLDTLKSIGDLARQREEQDKKNVDASGQQKTALLTAELTNLQEQLKNLQAMNAPISEQLALLSDIESKTKQQLNNEINLLVAKGNEKLAILQAAEATGQWTAESIAAQREFEAIGAQIATIRTRLSGVLISADALTKVLQRASLPTERQNEILSAQIPIYERRLRILQDTIPALGDETKHIQEQVAILSQIDQLERQILENKIRSAEESIKILRASGGTAEQIAAQEQALKLLVLQQELIGRRVEDFYRELAKKGRDAADSIAKDFVDKFVDFLANANTKGGFKQFFDNIAISFGKTIFTSILQAGLSNLLSKFDLISDTLKQKGGAASLSDLLMDALKQMISKTPLHDFWVGIFGDSSAIFKDVLSGVDEKLGEKIGDIGSAIDAAMKSIPESSQEGLAAIAQGATGLITTSATLATSATQLQVASTGLGTVTTGLNTATLGLNSSATALNGAAVALMEAAAALKGVVAIQANQTGSIALPEILTTTTDTGNRLPPEPVITEEDITGQPSVLENPTIEIDATNANAELDSAMESIADSLKTGADTAARSIEAGGENISESFKALGLDFDNAGDSLLESSSELTAMLDTNVAEAGQALGELGDDATGLSTDFSSLVDPLKRFGDTLLGAGQSVLKFIQSITGLDFGGFFGGLGGLFSSSTLAPTTMTGNVMPEVSPIIEQDILEQSSGFAEPLLTSGLDNINVSEGLDRSIAVITDSFDQLAPSLQGFGSGLDVSIQNLSNLGPDLANFSQSLGLSSFDVEDSFDDLSFNMKDFEKSVGDATSGLGGFIQSLGSILGSIGGGIGSFFASLGSLIGFGHGGLVYAGRGMTVANQTSPYVMMGGRGMRGMHAIVGEEGDELVARMKPGRPNAESRDNAPIEQTIIIQDNRSRGLTKADMIVTIGDDVIRDGPISKSFKNVIKRTTR